MKRILSFSPLILFIIHLFFASCIMAGLLDGYDFYCYHPSVILGVLALLSLGLTAAMFLLKISVNKGNGILSALLLPLSILNGLYDLSGNWGLHLAFALVSLSCSVAILIRFAWPAALKILSAVLSGGFVLILLWIMPVAYTMQGISTDTVINTVSSPQNTYRAEVVDHDEGALGGKTLVNIRDNRKTIPILIGELVAEPVCIYTGEWGEFEHMQIDWADDHTLVINGDRFSVNG